jgi:predicted glycoside hydrolase/deacetylase ChbG (UPF0249 family)
MSNSRPPSRPARRLIVNADDFGQSEGINRGVARCHEAGILTSASLMVRWPAAASAAEYACAHGRLAVGLHLDFCEWTCETGRWFPLYEVVPLRDEVAVREEIDRQLTSFHTLMGCDPTHLDSHQHAHQEEPVRQAVIEAAARRGIPVRGFHPAVRYMGDFYGQGKNGLPRHDTITVEYLTALLDTLPEGITELGCHPAFGLDLQSVYLTDREQEVAVLCDPRIRAAVHRQNIELVSFRDLPALLAADGATDSHV